MIPRRTWVHPEDYDRQAAQLAEAFKDNFRQFEEGTHREIAQAGPK